jgi:hypothetical protein
MEKLRTSLTIIRHSLGVMVRHPRLLVFPAIGTVAALVVYIFFLAPLLFDTTMGEIWYTLRLPDERWDAIAPWRAESDAAGSLWQRHFFAYAGYYLIAMFTMNFVNVALYSQIIEAMNGGRVSVARGVAVACGKLRAIIAWSIMAGVVGAILRALQERLGFPGKWVAAIAGLTWSAASVFVIPVIINEPESRSPLDYVRISTALVKRVWGEGVAGIAGLALVYVLMMVVLFILTTVTVSVSDSHAMQVATVLSVAAIVVFYVLYLGWQIFECGLYVYATEGVAPGTFDAALFDRVWTVRQGSPIEEGAPVNRRIPWKNLALVIPAVLMALSFWLPSLLRQSTWLEHPESDVGGVQIDLGKLGYRLGIEDLRAAGLFVEERSPAEALFDEGSTEERFTGQPDASGLQAEMFRNSNELWIAFYGQDASGKERVSRHVQALRQRFPGHEDAIVLDPGRHAADYRPRTTRISWGNVQGADSYSLEIDCFECCREGRWCSEDRGQWKVVTGVRTTSYSFDWVGAQRGRVRIWGVNAAGRKGRKSPWTPFEYSW